MAIDRNQRARDDFALAAERRKFQQAFAAGAVFVTDRFGNRIEPGDVLVYLPPSSGIVCQVGALTPVLDPGAQPGFVRLTLVTEIPLTYRGGTIASDMLVMRKQAQIKQEMQDAGAAAPDAAPPETEEPPPVTAPTDVSDDAAAPAAEEPSVDEPRVTLE